MSAPINYLSKHWTSRITTPKSAKILSQCESYTFANSPLLSSNEDYGVKLGKGGYGTAYLYWSIELSSYRVLKKYHKLTVGLGGVARRVRVFNEFYNTAYDGKLNFLATARVLQSGQQEYLDMPYIEGPDIDLDVYENYSDSNFNNHSALMQLFQKSGFFIRDYSIPGNIVFGNDNEGNTYFLVRDVDEMATRKSFQLTFEESISHQIETDIQNGDKEPFIQATRGIRKEKPVELIDETQPSSDISRTVPKKKIRDRGNLLNGVTNFFKAGVKKQRNLNFLHCTNKVKQ